VPDFFTTQGEIRVQASNGGIPVGYSATPFTILAPITNVSTGGSVLLTPGGMTISWTEPAGFDGSVALNYSTDGGQTFTNFFNQAGFGGPAPTSPQTESITVSVPNKPTTQGVIQIVPADMPLVPTGYSAPFTIMGATTTTVQSGVNPSTYGQSSTLTAMVSSPAPGTPSGSVDFFDTTTNTDLGSTPLLSGQAVLTTSQLGAGSHAISATYSGDPLFTLSSAITTQMVTPAALTVTANDASKVYGTPNPGFGVSYQGFVNNEGPGQLGGTLAFSTAATTSSDVGSYSLTPGGLTSSNYTISFVPGTLQITKADQTVTWAKPAAITYGSALGAAQLDAMVSVAGPAPAGALSYTPAAGTVLHAGTGQVLSVAAAGTNDYNAASASVTLDVNPAPLTVTANDAALVYGSPNPTFGDTISGFVNGDGLGVVSGSASLTTSATAASDVGSYPIVAALGSLSAADYVFAFTNGTLTVSPAALTVTVANASKVYGQDDSAALTGSITGIENNDPITASYSSPGSGASAAPGTYAIDAALADAGSGKLGDYNVTILPGTLTVTKANTATAATVSAATPLYGVDTVTFTAGVSVLAPGSGNPTGSVDFFDTTTHSDLGSVGLSGGTASLTTGSLAVGQHVIEVVYSGDSSFLPSTGSATLQVLKPSTFGGFVWEDFNNDGQIDFNEPGISGVAVTLQGKDDLGHAVNVPATTDGAGLYEFTNLRPGAYYVTASQPAGYNAGIDSVGTVNGVPTGSVSAVEQLFINLAAGVDAINYNFGQRPVDGGAVATGQTAQAGFWNNKNGQALISSLNGGATSTQLGNWLAATFTNLFGASAGSHDLAGLTNAQVAAVFQQDLAVKGQKLDAQVLATALSVYVTDQTLAGNVAAAYGFTVSQNGLGVSTVNVGADGAAVGKANGTTMSVLDILFAADALSADDNGLLYGGNTTLRHEAFDLFSTLNSI
jgi:hypothetical protein